MSASEMDDLLDEIGSGLGCTPYLDGGAIGRAEAALSKLRAALSGSSAPQAPNSEELLKALRVALERIANCNGADPEWDEDCEPDTPAAIARAALSTKSDGSDPDSSQKGEP